MIETQTAVCPGCESVSSVIGITKGEAVFRCHECSLLFYEQSVRAQLPKDSDWWRDLSENGGVVLKKSLAQMRPMFNRQLAQLEKMTERRQLLDVGAGGGVFLAAARERGWKVMGHDSNPHAAAAAKAAFDLFFVSGLNEIAKGSVDVVRLSHVLEHVPFPVDFLREMRLTLHAEGVIVAIVPNAASLSYSVVNSFRRKRVTLPRLALPMSPGFHPLGFTPRALEIVAKSAGFTVISLRSVSMGNRDYYPWFYDGLLRRIPLSEIGLKTLVRYWGPIALDNFGNKFGRGHWLVASLRRAH